MLICCRPIWHGSVYEKTGTQPAGCKTMRAVITGGPSVGKTTIITLLAERGFRVVEEFATQIIKEGKILPWVDRSKFQAEVLRRQVQAESAIRNYPGPIFLDRGLFDGE